MYAMSETIALNPVMHKKLMELIVKAGKEALRIRQNGELIIDTKPDGSFVTNGDMASNTILTQGLAELFPDTAIISEEGKKPNPTGTYTSGWVIDPIDGTKAYKDGKPTFGVLVAWVEGGVPIHGFAYYPAPEFSEMYFTGTNGIKAYKQKIRTKDDGSLEWGTIMELKTSMTVGKPKVAEVFTNAADFFPGEYSKLKGHDIRKAISMIEGQSSFVAGPDTMCDWDLAAIDAIARQANATFISTNNRFPLIYGLERPADRAYLQPRYIGGNNDNLKRWGLITQNLSANHSRD
jgi:3'(2'), 5'-bisphosphate nucleotidase